LILGAIGGRLGEAGGRGHVLVPVASLRGRGVGGVAVVFLRGRRGPLASDHGQRAGQDRRQDASIEVHHSVSFSRVGASLSPARRARKGEPFLDAIE